MPGAGDDQHHDAPLPLAQIHQQMQGIDVETEGEAILHTHHGVKEIEEEEYQRGSRKLLAF